MKKVASWLCFAILISALIAPAAWAQGTAIIESGRDGTLIYNVTGDVANGIGDRFWVGTDDQVIFTPRRGVIYFDVAGTVPAGSVIDSAKLHLWMADNITLSSHRIAFHRLQEDWGEGVSSANPAQALNGVPSQPNDATWIHRMHSGALWTGMGADGDYVGAGSDSGDYTDLGPYTTELRSAAIIADIQSWRDDPSSNHGWIMIGDESQANTGKAFSTHENGASAKRPRLEVWWSVPTAVNESEAVLPETVELRQNYPNPFNPSTEIEFALARASRVELTVYDLSGRYVTTLADGPHAAGVHRVTWDGTTAQGESVASGVFFYSVRGAAMSATKKMVLIR